MVGAVLGSGFAGAGKMDPDTGKTVGGAIAGMVAPMIDKKGGTAGKVLGVAGGVAGGLPTVGNALEPFAGAGGNGHHGAVGTAIHGISAAGNSAAANALSGDIGSAISTILTNPTNVNIDTFTEKIADIVLPAFRNTGVS